MKWIGLALLVLGGLLALDHRSWYVPVGFGCFLLAHWYWVEREPDEVVPDEVDSSSQDLSATNLQESSTSLDLPDVLPFLQRLSIQITGNYTQKAVAHVVDLAASMKHGEDRDLEYEVLFQGKLCPLKIGLFKDDIEEITLYFFTIPSLADFIDAEMEAFFEARHS